MKTTNLIWIAVTFWALAGALEAAGEKTESSGDSTPTVTLPKVKLNDLLAVVSRKSGKTFLATSRVPADVVVGPLAIKDVDYPALLLILRNNDLAAVTDGDITTITWVRVVRQQALPLLEDNDVVANGEWVTRVVQLKNISAPHLVPILRPLMPQAGHLAAHPQSNSLLIADRYGNLKRILALAAKLDSLGPYDPPQ